MEVLKAKDTILKPLIDLLPSWITPNGLAVFRLFMVIPIGFFAVEGQGIPTAFLLLAAYATDLLDGALARIRHQVTKAGAVLDPIADKTIFIVLFWILGWKVVDPTIFTILILMELVFLLYGPVYAMVPKKSVVDRKFGSNIFGKLKTVCQVLGLLLLTSRQAHVPGTLLVAQIIFALAVVFSVISFSRHVLSRHNVDEG